MNTSLLTLSLQKNFNNSPFITATTLKHSLTFSLGRLSHFFSTFFFAPLPASSAFTRTTFTHTLETPIVYEDKIYWKIFRNPQRTEENATFREIIIEDAHSDTHAGGLHVDSKVSVTLENSIISNCSTSKEGGGLFICPLFFTFLCTLIKLCRLTTNDGDIWGNAFTIRNGTTTISDIAIHRSWTSQNSGDTVAHFLYGRYAIHSLNETDSQSNRRGAIMELRNNPEATHSFIDIRNCTAEWGINPLVGGKTILENSNYLDCTTYLTPFMIYNDVSGPFILRNCCLYGNKYRTEATLATFENCFGNMPYTGISNTKTSPNSVRLSHDCFFGGSYRFSLRKAAGNTVMIEAVIVICE